MSAARWIVGVTKTCERLAVFDSEDEAARFIDTLPNHVSGIYYLDGPCKPLRVVFLADDPYGLWRAGDTAEDRGWESPGSPVRVLRMERDDQTITLTDPFSRNIIREVTR